MKFAVCALSFIFLSSCSHDNKPVIVVGSKTFTESYILSEVIAQTIEDAGEARVERRLGLGATGIIFESLRTGQIDIYPEYTGTISETILKNASLATIPEINLALAEHGVVASESLGFNDTYALAMSKDRAKAMSISKISDLKAHPDIRAGFTHEFLKREDGFDALSKRYGLALKNYAGMEHSLAYASLAEKKIDLVEVYSTDAKILKYDLQILKDDLEFFPKYLAVFLMKKDFAAKFPKSWQALKNLEGKITEEKMVELNGKVELDGWNFAKAASYYLNRKETVDSAAPRFSYEMFLKRTKEHLALVFLSLFAAIIVSVPLGLWAARSRRFAQVILAVSGLLQTIPSLALLCFLIPVFGIGYTPAVIALFLYALLPIVRNTYLGLTTIDTRLLESARTLGLSRWDQLRLIELPLASPAIVSGIKLSAVINVGTATLAAFIGAGGYGAIIVTGLALNDTNLILQGAVPSAVLALLVHGVFEILDRNVVPKGLRIDN